MTTRKPRGVVGRFLAGEGVDDIGLSLVVKPFKLSDYFKSIRKVEDVLRRALRKKGRGR
jgi:hypothetical protein